MKRTLLVPVDFTPVSHNALQYACELAKLHTTEIVAVHLLDNNILADMLSLPESSVAMRKMMERMYNEIIEKTLSDLSNFISDLKTKYGDIIQPLITHGSIYEAFNDLAAKYDSSLIVMGTHGITGLQHLAGSRAYKVVLHTKIPFLVVQNKPFTPINTLYFAFKNTGRFQDYAGTISELSDYFPGKFVISVMGSESNNIPAELQQLASRISLINNPLDHENMIVCATTAGADAICISIDEFDNMDDDTYGMTQDKILANKEELPVLCLPQI